MPCQWCFGRGVRFSGLKMLPICTSYAVGWIFGLCLMDDYRLDLPSRMPKSQMKIYRWDSLLKMENLPGGDWHPRKGG